MGDALSKPSPWDQSFESEFQNADSNFREVIDWLEALNRIKPPLIRPIETRILAEQSTDEQFSKLIECVVSLAVRCPMYREKAIRVAEDFRGPIESSEKSSLIGANIRYSLRNALRQINGKGKALVIYSPEKEFIFGDGFYSNLTLPLDYLRNPKLLIPLTPRLSVLFVHPYRYMAEPRLTTVTISAFEADSLNLAVQIYAKNAVFYRSDRPVITNDFSCGKHLIFNDHNNPVDNLIRFIPGIFP